MLDDILLKKFAKGFFGCGNYDAPIWLIGMEEGGGKELDQVTARLNAWEQRGCREIENIAEYHQDFGVTKFWDEKPPTQPTWRKLIRAILTSKAASADQPLSFAKIRRYQRDQFGRDIESCLLELLPLPSPSKQEWLYPERSLIPELESRESYAPWLLPKRIKHIQNKINEHKPVVVLFYGFDYREHWTAIAEAEFIELESIRAFTGYRDSTRFLIAKHPASVGSTNEYWQNLGVEIKNAISGTRDSTPPGSQTAI